MLTGNQIRHSFLSYFEENGHTIVPSASLIPSNDPTLLFTNAGMVPFKNVFLGSEKRPYTRATSSQRCVRAGGKHNDLENVGHTARHHTFFEMMGNFSFGDYFKKEAIPFAWRWVTERLHIDPTRLCVTVYHEDDEAYNIWHKDVGVAKDRIIRISTADNFWTMGPTGPCGPCTEIFYDHGAHIPGGMPGTPEEDGDRWVEIWNVVFMQYYMENGEIARKLEKTGVDTGSGLERVMAVAQGVHSNYDTDLFQSLIKPAAELVGTAYGKNAEADVSLRVLADHLRAMSFMMVDGVMPGNEGRGYVLRRIMRRAMRHGNLLGMEKPFIHKLVPTLVGAMGQAYPELGRAEQMVADGIKVEEERFSRTLSQGLKLLEQEARTLKTGDTLPGDVAFKLYDTYGFPLDLTQDALKTRSITVDEKGFETAMADQRARARKASLGTGQEKLSKVWFDLRDSLPASEFLGYSTTQVEGVAQALVQNDAAVKTLNKGDKGALIASQTPFYGEGGGQVGDLGTITGPHGKAVVTDTTKLFDGQMVVHHVKVAEGSLNTGDDINLVVDGARRNNIRRNHSATHLLHAALRETLGDHVFQKGSLVTDEKLRFDFSHNKGLTADEITTIENRVNSMIWANAPVNARIMDHKAAIAAGAMALFGEKYGDEVRVLTMGEGEGTLSVELCGGTHVSRTGDIGLFKITAETSISSGVRRIEGMTGEGAFNHLRGAENQLKALASDLKTSTAELPARLSALQDENKKLDRALKEARKGGAGGANGGDLLASAENVGGIRFVGAVVGDLEANLLREMVDDLKNRIGSGVIVLGSSAGGKANLVAGVTADLTGRFNAGKIVGLAAEQVGGRGGGRPDMAMAGGKDASRLNDAIAAARGHIAA